MESKYLSEFLNVKKEIHKIRVRDRFNMFAMYDHKPKKFFFYNLNVDPFYASFLLNKVVNAFAKHGNKKKIRHLFYQLFLEEDSDFEIGMLFDLIESLKPSYINVPARRGRIVYKAPIAASDFRAVMKAIRFFKQAVMSRRTEDSLYLKI